MELVQLRTIIDRLCDKLWAAGLTNPVTYIEQIGYLFFLKMLEEWDNTRVHEARLTGNHYDSIFADDVEKYRWSVWSQMPDNVAMHRFVRDEVFPFVMNLPSTNREEIRRLFRDAQFLIPDGVVLRDVVDLLRDVELISLDADVKGDLYEHLLKGMATQARAGQFLTPRHIVRSIVQMLDPQIGETIHDPACGTGGFLIATYEWIRLQNSDPANVVEFQADNGMLVRKGPGDKLTPTQWQFLHQGAFFGTDVDAHIVKIGMMNLILHGLERSDVRRRDAIAGGPDEWEERRFDVVMTNPPFSGSVNRERVRKSLPVLCGQTEILFLGLVMNSLRDGGKAGIIVPAGVLDRTTGAYREIRRMLLEENTLHTVISLPGGVFNPYSGVRTGILIFSSGGKTDKVWFYTVQHDGYDLGATRRPTPERNDLPDLLERFPYQHDGTQLMPNPERLSASESANSWWATIEDIRRNDYVLTASRYSPHGFKEEEHEEPLVLLDEILSQQRGIYDELAALKKELEGGGLEE